MAAHICEYTKIHWIVYFKWIVWYVNYNSLKLHKNQKKRNEATAKL